MAYGDNEELVNLFSKPINIRAHKGHDGYILSMKKSANNKYLVTCSATKKIKMLSISMNKEESSIIEYKALKGYQEYVTVSYHTMGPT